MDPKNNLDPISLDDWLDIRIGKTGTPERDFFELNIQIKIINELIDNISSRWNAKRFKNIVERFNKVKTYHQNARKSLPENQYAKFENELTAIENRLNKFK